VVNSDVDPRSLSDVFVPLAAGDRDKYLEDLFASRQLLEVECAGLAARRRSAGQLEAMHELVESLAGAVGDGPVYARLDYVLHHAIVEAADNLFLEKIHALLHDQLQPVICRSVNDQAHRRESMLWHRRIVGAIAAGDETAARDQMAGHLGACRLAYGM
jgi:DNA-binding FadR family transcriptional regulator